MFYGHNVNHVPNLSVFRAPCIATSFVGILVVAACGSSGSSSSPTPGPEAGTTDSGGDGGGGYTLTNCPADGVASAACTSCLQTMCSTDLSDVNTSCADYFACGCPIDAGSSCTPSTSCASALLALNDQCTSCDVCEPAAPDGGGYTLTNCPALAVTSACASCIQTSCPTELSAIDSACASYLACACPAGANTADCTPSADCAIELAEATVGCSCGTECGATDDGGPSDAESVESGSDGAPSPTDAAADGTVAGGDAGGSFDAAVDAGERFDAAVDAGDAAVAPNDASSDGQADALGTQDAATVTVDAGPEAAAANDAEPDESEGGADGG